MTFNYPYARYSPLGFVIVLLATVGCGGPAATVYGVVEMDGQAVEPTNGIRGTVMFEPLGTGGVPAVASIGSGGRFQVMTGTSRGLEPGDYNVAICVMRTSPPLRPGYPAQTHWVSHPKYTNSKTSGIKAKVASGSNQFDFEIESAPKRG